jgi:hypothetical protein
VAEPLQIVATAVTPVVMVSATAILAGVVNTRYISISDRVRMLAHEYREKETPDARKELICSQMGIFHRRVVLVSWSIRMCYMAMALFILMALDITATAFRRNFVAVTVPLFVAGISFLLTAIVLQLMELQSSNRTIAIEVQDVLECRQEDAGSKLKSA